MNKAVRQVNTNDRRARHVKKDDWLEVFRDLIRIKTVNPPGDERVAIDYIKSILDRHLITSSIAEPKAGRANLIASLQGGSGDPLVLLSHIDTVDADANQWREDPFSAALIDHEIWGRGTLDTKQLSVMHLAAFIELHRLSTTSDGLKRPVHLVITADEEKGSQYGMAYLAEHYAWLFHNATVLSEGGGFPLEIKEKPYMTVASAEKSVLTIELLAYGKPGHALMPHKNQAVQKLIAAVTFLLKQPVERRYSTISKRYILEAGLNPESVLGSECLADGLVQHMLFDQMKVCDLAAISSDNAIPAKALATIELRVDPSVSLEACLANIRRQLAGYDVEIKVKGLEHGYESNPDHPLLALVSTSAKRHGFMGDLLPFVALGRTDGRFIGHTAASIFGLSPALMTESFPRVLERVHRTDERIHIDSFTFGLNVLRDALVNYCFEGDRT